MREQKHNKWTNYLIEVVSGQKKNNWTIYYATFRLSSIITFDWAKLRVIHWRENYYYKTREESYYDRHFRCLRQFFFCLYTCYDLKKLRRKKFTLLSQGGVYDFDDLVALNSKLSLVRRCHKIIKISVLSIIVFTFVSVIIICLFKLPKLTYCICRCEIFLKSIIKCFILAIV